MLTKLRPFVHTFLKEASRLFEMYIYTMGERAYALEVARVLDPGRVYFNSKVISQSDCTQRHQKGLDVILGAESTVLILDDTEMVISARISPRWPWSSLCSWACVRACVRAGVAEAQGEPDLDGEVPFLLLELPPVQLPREVPVGAEQGREGVGWDTRHHS